MHGADAKPNLTRHLVDADSGVVVGWFCGGISEDRYDWCLSDELRESCEGTAHRTDHSCCAGQSKERPAHIQSLGKSYGRCGGSSASRSPSRPSSSPRSGARPSPRLALRGWWSGQGSRRSLHSRRTRTCSGTPAVMRSRIKGMPREHCKRTSGTRISSIPCGTRNYHPLGSGISGESEWITDA
jgi:hypothetical protein